MASGQRHQMTSDLSRVDLVLLQQLLQIAQELLCHTHTASYQRA